VLGVGVWARVRGTATDYVEAGLIGLSIAFGFFAVGHFVRTAPMSEMLPPWVPNRVVLIYATGALEIFLALALMVQKSRRLAGWSCIAVLVLFFPANIYAAFNKVGMGGHLWGPVYLFVRTPLQIILIVWTYWFAIRRQTNERSG
jgi:uncharacterized membrane protein